MCALFELWCNVCKIFLFPTSHALSTCSLLDVLMGVWQQDSALKDSWKYQSITSVFPQRICVFVCVYIYLAVSRVIPVCKERSEKKSEIRPERESMFQGAYAIQRNREGICQVECNHSGIIIWKTSCLYELQQGCIRWLGFHNPPRHIFMQVWWATHRTADVGATLVAERSPRPYGNPSFSLRWFSQSFM